MLVMVKALPVTVKALPAKVKALHYVKVKALPVKVKALPVKVNTACKDHCTDCKVMLNIVYSVKQGTDLLLFLNYARL